MRTFYLKDFNEEEFEKIMGYLDEVETSKEEGQIYINSGGGSVWVLDSIHTRLQELLDKGIKIKLRATFIASCAFDLFYKYKGEKILEVGCDAVVHVAASQFYGFTNNGETKIRTSDLVERKRFEEYVQVFNYDFLTVKETKLFNNGEDIYLNYDRLKSVFGKKFCN